LQPNPNALATFTDIKRRVCTQFDYYV